MRIPIIAAFLAFSSLALAAPPDLDTPETRIQAANRYADAVDMKKIVNDMVSALVKNQPPEKQEATRRLLSQYNFDAVLEAVTRAMVNHFTTSELNALADFYGSDIGRSITAKYSEFAVEMMAITKAEAQRTLQQGKAR
jgi:hypothetical protein